MSHMYPSTTASVRLWLIIGVISQCFKRLAWNHIKMIYLVWCKRPLVLPLWFIPLLLFAQHLLVLFEMQRSSVGARLINFSTALPLTHLLLPHDFINIEYYALKGQLLSARRQRPIAVRLKYGKH